MKTHLTGRITLGLLAVTAMMAAATHAGTGAHWGYQGAEGPTHWGELDPKWHSCSDGSNQSPIDVQTAVDTDLPPLEFHYAAGGDDEINNGHTIEIHNAPGSSLVLDGRRYELKQFHFHAPSENRIAGREFPLEAHLVHTDAEGHLAVIAVMFEAGAHNAALAAAWQQMPVQPNSHHPLASRVSAESLLPSQRDYYRFNGSLTTPPCNEGVTWILMKQPVTAGQEQIAQFARVMGHPNNRPLQPLNARVVLE